MSKLYQNLFIVLAIAPFFTFVALQENLEDVMCIDCKNTTGNDCKIKSTGYQCFPTKKKDTFFSEEFNVSYFYDEPPEYEELEMCIPESITIKSVKNYCCVWSPQLGCQVLRAWHIHTTALDCVRCTIHDLDRADQPMCPCVDSSASQMCVSALVLVGVILVL